jgi:hypothetical protein
MDLPSELRLMIYRFHFQAHLDGPPIEAMRCLFPFLGAKIPNMSNRILRVSKQIHEEAADVFYGEKTFEVTVSNGYRCWDELPKIRMCSTTLEVSGENNANSNKPRASSEGLRYPTSAYQQPLPETYLQKIRSFHINIHFDLKASTPTVLPDGDIPGADLDRDLMCDSLHRLVECLVSNRDSPLREIKVSISVDCCCVTHRSGIATATHKVLNHAAALLQPLYRLRASKVLVALAPNPLFDEWSKLNQRRSLLPKKFEVPPPFVQAFSKELQLPGKSPPQSAVRRQFIHLTELIAEMSEYRLWSEEDLKEMQALLRRGRRLREEGDSEGMSKITLEVDSLVSRRDAEHQAFMEHMGRLRRPRGPVFIGQDEKLARY